VARKYLVFVLLIGLVSMVGPVAAADLARSPAGDYYMENPQGQVGSLHIEEISADRLKFSMHVAIPAICGTGMEGEAKWSGDRAVYSDDFCKKLTFVFDLGKVTLQTEKCGFGPEDKCTFNCAFTNEFTPPPGTEEEAVKDIRMHYAAVNSQTSWLESVEFKSKGWGGSGEMVEAYLYEGQVRKIKVTQPLKSGLHVEEYYFWLKRLIFCFTGKAANAGQSSDTPMTDVERYYFSRDKLIRWLDYSGQQVPPTEKRFQERRKEILKKAKDLSTKALSAEK
jgi:hypothetical protein